MANATTPPRVRQTITLAVFRDYIWYGERKVFDKSYGEKEKLVLPKSLFAYTLAAEKCNLKELRNFTKECDLIYNPEGYENNTWIITWKANDLETLVGGNLTLWSNKEINRKRGMIKEIKKQQEKFKYYVIGKD